ncbi:YbgC/FadM family acyl-CoA thioesterase [Formicincola oecophyllae]|uniref:YbgC/FadM family acyl-CoA thioesterase n=2 Tax=Formicincola oecophyllae TaxID=2558361 RepID=A0A4Y6UAC8_9PROT|nr:YbgC/FadM family acyl-CoA thioesterase [Formicincola oecophyllae]
MTLPGPLPLDAGHKCRFRVYYEDTDAGGIVYHARYLAFAERARAEALRAHGLEVGKLAQEGVSFVARHLEVDYKFPLRLDEVFEVQTTVTKQHGARLCLQQRILAVEGDGQRVAVLLQVELACVHTHSGKPQRIPSSCQRALRGLELPNQLSS